MRRGNADVTINTDNVYEGTEEFNLVLTFAQPRRRFFVIPNITTVTINDTTGEYIICPYSLTITLHCVFAGLTIGFIGAPYRAIEDMASIIFTVGVIGNTKLATDVVVSFSTIDGSTSGKWSVETFSTFYALFS